MQQNNVGKRARGEKLRRIRASEGSASAGSIRKRVKPGMGGSLQSKVFFQTTSGKSPENSLRENSRNDGSCKNRQEDVLRKIRPGTGRLVRRGVGDKRGNVTKGENISGLGN